MAEDAHRLPRIDFRSRELVLLAALLLVGLLLRLYKLNAPLWFDEVMTLGHFVRLPFGALVADYSSFNNHLFFSLQAKLAVLAFGETNWALRLPAVLFGVASIWAVWRLARTALPAGAALLAAALVTFSYHHIWFSQNARGYTGLMFWCLLSLLIYVEALGSRSWRVWLGFALAVAAAAYTHLTAGFFIVALGLVYLAQVLGRELSLPVPEFWLAPKDRVARYAPLLGFVGAGIVTLAACSPAIPQMLSMVSAVSEPAGPDLMREYTNPLWTIVEGIRTGIGTGGAMLAAIPAALLLIGLGAYDLLRRTPVIVAVTVLHLILTVAGLLALGMRIWPRFFFTDIALMLLFIASGAYVLARLLARAAALLGLGFATPERLLLAGGAAMLAASALLAARNYAAPKQDFVGPATLLAAEGAGVHSVGAVGLASQVYAIQPHTGWRPVLTAGDLERLTPTGGRRWAIVAFPGRTERENADVVQALRQRFHLVRKFPGTLGDGDVLVYASGPAGS